MRGIGSYPKMVVSIQVDNTCVARSHWFIECFQGQDESFDSSPWAGCCIIGWCGSCAHSGLGLATIDGWAHRRRQKEGHTRPRTDNQGMTRCWKTLEVWCTGNQVIIGNGRKNVPTGQLFWLAVVGIVCAGMVFLQSRRVNSQSARNALSFIFISTSARLSWELVRQKQRPPFEYHSHSPQEKLQNRRPKKPRKQRRAGLLKSIGWSCCSNSMMNWRPDKV